MIKLINKPKQTVAWVRLTEYDTVPRGAIVRCESSDYPRTTLGKTYTVLNSDLGCLRIHTDTNITWWFTANEFSRLTPIPETPS